MSRKLNEDELDPFEAQVDGSFSGVEAEHLDAALSAAESATNVWSLDSWRNKSALQQPTYPDAASLARVLGQIRGLPPIVASGEIETLKRHLGEVAMGKRFLIQGGDCSERFEECNPVIIAGKLKILLQVSLILNEASKMKIVRVGRIAGQYAKPRSSPVETRNGVTLPSYQGDLVNRPGFSAADRMPDPQHLLTGYMHSALTLNFIRSLVGSNYSKLDHPSYWDLGFAAHSPHGEAYRRVIDGITKSLEFVEASVGGPLRQMLTRFDFFTSHEGLHLPYEQALTRRVPHAAGWYNLGTHFPWIGERTRALTGAHVEYFRGIANPIAVKIGPSMNVDELVELARILNPENEPGRLTFIHRLGAAKIATHLPPLLDAIRRSGSIVAWCCDPMHGNTISEAGIKTRKFSDIVGEVRAAFQIHHDARTFLGGIHLEVTADDVTECIGGARDLNVDDLRRAYKTTVDPRLNHEQALELAFEVAQVMRKWHGWAKRAASGSAQDED